VVAIPIGSIIPGARSVAATGGGEGASGSERLLKQANQRNENQRADHRARGRRVEEN